MILKTSQVKGQHRTVSEKLVHHVNVHGSSQRWLGLGMGLGLGHLRRTFQIPPNLERHLFQSGSVLGFRVGIGPGLRLGNMVDKVKAWVGVRVR